MTTYVVTGIAGAVGNALGTRLINNGNALVGIDCLNEETKSQSEKRIGIDALKQLAEAEKVPFSFYETDINSGNLKEIFLEHQPKKVLHAAALVQDRDSVEKSPEFMRVNVEGTASVMDAVRNTSSIENMVFVSTRSAVGEVANADGVMRETDPFLPVNPYGASKQAGEAICHAAFKNHDIPITVIRLNPQICNRCDMMPRRLMTALHQEKTIQKYGTGLAVRDWLHLEDTVDALLTAAENPDGFQTFLIGTGRGTNLNELIATAEEVAGKKAIINNVPVPRGDAHFGGLADYSKIQATLGWEPKRTLEQGLDDLYTYLKTYVF